MDGGITRALAGKEAQDEEDKMREFLRIKRWRFFFFS